ncbi:hypothetical protein D5086_009767 [Populus alba]|uniref:Uncharacterized protein n=1 Tax=Populus alba TaxID=43335 RepID=A0ACC4C7G8_POPAL
MAVTRKLKLKDMFMGFEEIDGDDDIREEFPCPFCSEYFDIVGLCCHIDDEHTMESKNGVCPICAMRVSVDMVAHITLQHGNIFKISFSFELLIASKVAFPCVYMQRKRKSRRGGPHSTLSLLRKELREGNLQSLLGGSSCIVSSSNSAPDPLLSSFILPMADDFTSSQPSFLSETSVAKKSSVGNVSERNKKSPPMSIKDKEEKAKRRGGGVDCRGWFHVLAAGTTRSTSCSFYERHFLKVIKLEHYRKKQKDSSKLAIIPAAVR